VPANNACADVLIAYSGKIDIDLPVRAKIADHLITTVWCKHELIAAPSVQFSIDYINA
jgi:hypothetical protein